MWFRKKCPQCQSKMKKRAFFQNRDVFSYLLLDGGIVGSIALTLLLPGVGWVIGPALLVFCVWSGSKTRGAWVCMNFGYIEVFRHFGKSKENSGGIEE